MGNTSKRSVCRACGVLVPTKAQTCEQCGAGIDSPLVVEEETQWFWTAVEYTFRCPACHDLSPVDTLDEKQPVACANCGASRTFAVSEWKATLDFAHAVGDLAGPDPGGRFPSRKPSVKDRNSFKSLGLTKTFQQLCPDRKLAIKATAGHPLCDQCHQPLVAAKHAPGTLTVSCSKCAKQTQYHWPTSLHGDHPGLDGVLARAHETGGTDAVVNQDASGALTLHCPDCEAALDVGGRAGVVHCPYCHAAVRVPAQTLRKMGLLDLKPELWWLLWKGPSAQREAWEQEGIPPEKKAYRSLKRMYLSAAVLIVVGLGSGLLFRLASGPSPEQKLERFRFTMSKARVKKLLGVAPGNELKLDFNHREIIDSVEIDYGHGQHKWGFSMDGGDRVNPAGMDRRLEGLARKPLDRDELRTDHGSIEVDPSQGDIDASDITSPALADAYWAVAVYLAYGKPRPTRADIDAINGQ